MDNLLGTRGVTKALHYSSARLLEVFVVIKVVLDLLEGCSREIFERVDCIARIAIICWYNEHLIIHLIIINKLQHTNHLAFQDDTSRQWLIGDDERIKLIAIFIYILFRFRSVAFSVGAIVALAVDTFIIIGIYSVCWGFLPFSLEVDQTFIGAILTVIGYSINDKVVVFDRIRENIGLYPTREPERLFNESINNTLTRTIMTSFTTLLVLLCIFFLGGDAIRSFSFAMILGVIVGTLSSIFMAAPIAYKIYGRRQAKKAAKA